jgi:hypothetical protein
MKVNSSSFRRAVAVLSVILIIAYALIPVLPHTHGACGADCAVCSAIFELQNIFFGIVWIFILSGITHLGFSLLNTENNEVSGRTCTPVGLKVKLSD